MSGRTSETLNADLEKQQHKNKASGPENGSRHGDDVEAASSRPSTEAEAEADDPYEVTLVPEDDPKHFSQFKKWLIVLVICDAALCATFASSVASFTERGLATDLHTVHEVTILSISLFVEGLGLGPLLFSPLSEVFGRNNVYRISYFLFWVFTWPVAFPPDIETFLVFRFITGFCSSAFLSVAGGSVSDLFVNEKVATPMGVYTMSPFLGPVIGPLISGFICQHTDWRWAYRVLLIWQFVTLALLAVCVPETYAPIILKRKAARLRKETGNDKYWAPLDRREGSIGHMILMSIYTPFELLLFDRMALSLGVWNALILGILYLTFEAFPIIFENGFGFSYQETGMSFIGIGVGMCAALATQPLWNRFHRNKAQEYGGVLPPETRLIMGQVGAVLAPIALYWLAFTTYPSVPWIIPIIASVPYGMATYYIYSSTFTYLVTAYRPIAASAMASNTALRCTFAAAFPLFAGAMYDRLGTVGATALLAGLTTVMMPLPFVYWKYGAELRAKSRFAVR